MQAWLIARDNNSLLALLHCLRYEGHPALWYLLLYIPAHVSWNPISMQVINYLLALIEAWLLLSARKLDWRIRALAVFSYFMIGLYGVQARSYMLAMVLLTAAARCLLAERPHRKLAVLLLALSINTHILAIPIAGGIALWAFFFAKISNGNGTRKPPLDTELIVASIVLISSFLIAYLTVRPPADLLVTLWSYGHHSLPYDFVRLEGSAWIGLIPAYIDSLPAGLRGWMDTQYHISFVGSVFSLALFLVVAPSLRSNQARYFFLGASTLFLIALAATIRYPGLRYYGFIFTAFLIALMLDAYAGSGEAVAARSLKRSASIVVLAILTLQVLAGFYASAESSLIHPHSSAKDAAVWLKQQGLNKNPLVLDNYLLVPVVGYMERPSVYFVGCRCLGSYAVQNTKWDPNRELIPDDIRFARDSSPYPVIVLHYGQGFDAARAKKLGLVEIHSIAPDPRSTDRSITIYEQRQQ
jgi:hypothetical protein